MSSWKGKTRGGLLGYKIFVFVIEHFGLSSSYFLLKFVSFYFVLFSPASFKSMFYFYHERLHYGAIKSFVNIYRNFYLLGQMLIDKVALMSGAVNDFKQIREGGENLDRMIENKTGGLLISAHVGNFEVGSHLLKRLDAKINVVMLESERLQIKRFLSAVMSEKKFNIIGIKEDKSHIFEIMNALNNKEIVCIHADRYLEGMDLLEENFLGKKAKFPAGPFVLASKLNVPVSFVFVNKTGKKRYQFYASKPDLNKKDAIGYLKDYLYNLEKNIYKYPGQWFNHYPFWGEA